MADVIYVASECRTSRRYIAHGAEINTAIAERRIVQVRNGRLAGERFTFDQHGFMFLKHQTQIRDFQQLSAKLDSTYIENTAALAGEPYAGEICSLIQGLTQADLVLTLNCMFRHSTAESRKVQPPAVDVHVDMATPEANRRARSVLEQHGWGGRKFSRFIATSTWRAFSEPPQDWPLAVCDGRSVADGEGIPNYIVMTEKPPTAEDLTRPIANESELPTGNIFHYNPEHRWYFFPDMTRDDVLTFKLHDSDHTRAWRVPHVAFHDREAVGAHPRESVEFRTIAYFD